MKKLHFFPLLMMLTISGSVGANTPSSIDLEKAVKAVNNAQNRAMLSTASIDDLDKLFDLYTDDFVYVHKVYGGTYTREELYGNAAKYIAAKHYKLTEERYKVLRVLPGFGAAAVERLEVASGKTHLSVFEFEGNKVSKIIEYWE
ncbi:hypothetical protein [Microbulbifer taiwanensis]|uniref:Nuclear transport factor 2 family protein n=1 Tax=Microbulbifer taiwanensis TaxID=986746 RepID=A0ABW1YNG9_9GAMM|nr:hypothetical protein [Microbulbifer taiwanensis]